MIICVTMRYGSKRLPGKALLDLGGVNSIDVLVGQLDYSRHLPVFCCPEGSGDDPIVEYIEKLGVGCYRGSLENVLERMVGAAEHCGSDAFVRVTGDDLFIDPVYLDKLAEAHEASDADISVSDLPKGTETIVISTAFASGLLSSYGDNTEMWDRQRSNKWAGANVKLVPLSPIAATPDTFALELDTVEDQVVIMEVLLRLKRAGIEQPYRIEDLAKLHLLEPFPSSRDPVDRTYFESA